MKRVDCTFWTDINNKHCGACSHQIATKFVGTRPGITACARCPFFDGAERPAIQLTIGNVKPKKSRTEQAAEWLYHEAELLKQGPVSEAVHNHRKQCCTGLTIEGVRLSPACSAFKPDKCDPSTGFCKQCSCGSRERARIGRDGTKLHCPTYQCPRKVWGPMPGTGPESLGERAAQVVGIIKAAGAEVCRIFNLAR